MGVSLSRKTGVEEQIGDVKYSVLTEAQFQSLRGTAWVLMDGRSVVGSDLATSFGITTLPDSRGIHIRGKNNGRADGNQNPDGELAIGAFQADQVTSHNHGLNGTADGTPLNQYSSGAYRLAAQSGFANPVPASTFGGNETRPKSITLNTFIKINK